MAKTLMSVILFTLFYSSSNNIFVAAKNPDCFSETLDSKALGLTHKRETLTHLHFYFHEIVSAPNPTSVRVASANTTNASPTLFGLVALIDDALTVGPDRASRLMGRAQGMYGLASQSESMMLMAVNFVFTEGKFNGSTITVLGRNPILPFGKCRSSEEAGGSGSREATLGQDFCL